MVSEKMFVGHQVPEISAQSERIADLVSYHKPDADGVRRIDNIRAATQQMLLAILDNCPDSSDRAAAVQHARTAMMFANASIVVPQGLL
jgi:hypothetical protein